MNPELNKWYIKTTDYEKIVLTELIYLESYNSEYDNYSGCNIVLTQYKFPDKLEVVTMNNHKIFNLIDIMWFECCKNPLEYLNSWTKKYFDLCKQERKNND